MQDGRREAIHNPPQGKATQGGEQHGYQPSERSTNPTRANGRRGGKEEETRDVWAGHKASNVLLFHRDWIRLNNFYRDFHPKVPDSMSLFLTRSDVEAVCQNVKILI